MLCPVAFIKHIQGGTYVRNLFRRRAPCDSGCVRKYRRTSFHSSGARTDPELEVQPSASSCRRGAEERFPEAPQTAFSRLRFSVTERSLGIHCLRQSCARAPSPSAQLLDALTRRKGRIPLTLPAPQQTDKHKHASRHPRNHPPRPAVERHPPLSPPAATRAVFPIASKALGPRLPSGSFLPRAGVYCSN